MIYCLNCKASLKDNARFCHVCGMQISQSFSSSSLPLNPQTSFEKPVNRQRIYALIWLFVTIGFMICMMLPFFIEIDMMQGGGAMVFVGFIMFITGAIVTPFFFRRSIRFSAIVSGKDTLANWTYQPQEWAIYTANEFKKRKNESWGIFWLITIISLIVNIILCFAIPDGVAIFIIVQLLIMLIMSIAAFLSARIPHQRNKKQAGKTIIAPYGIYLNGSFHSWKGLSSRLELVQLIDNNSILEFTYSAMVRHGKRQNYTVNVPVPSNELAAALKIVAFFSQNKV